LSKFGLRGKKEKSKDTRTSSEVKGGCNPAPLNRKMVDGKVVIQIDDILKGGQYFDFSRRS